MGIKAPAGAIDKLNDCDVIGSLKDRIKKLIEEARQKAKSGQAELDAKRAEAQRQLAAGQKELDEAKASFDVFIFDSFIPKLP